MFCKWPWPAVSQLRSLDDASSIPCSAEEVLLGEGLRNRGGAGPLSTGMGCFQTIKHSVPPRTKLINYIYNHQSLVWHLTCEQIR